MTKITSLERTLSFDERGRRIHHEARQRIRGEDSDSVKARRKELTTLGFTEVLWVRDIQHDYLYVAKVLSTRITMKSDMNFDLEPH